MNYKEELYDFMSQLCIVTGINTHHDYDGIEDDQDIQIYKSAVIKNIQDKRSNIQGPVINISHALDQLQDNCIGLFKTHGTMYMVLSESDGLHAARIADLGGLQELHINCERGVFSRFPDGKSLLEFKANPFALKAFIDKFN